MRASRDEEFRRFVIDRRADLLRTATLLTAGDRHLAEDVVQSTLTRLYLAWPLFTRAANPDGYARRALVNALMDEHRRPWRRQERSSPEVPDLPTVEPQAGTERTDALNAALGDLPPRMRAALVYRYFHDLSVADTADALSCSQGTVKSQTARALERLRTVMDATPPETPTPCEPHFIPPLPVGRRADPSPHQEHLMSDIRTLLHDAAVLPDTDTDTDTFTAEAAADADLVRARRALRRRRAGRTTAASGLLAAAALGAFMIIGPGNAPSTPPAGATPAAPRNTTSGVELVAYTGAQPTGYRLDTVPVGWTIRDDTRSLLTLAPKGAATAGNTEPGATDLEGTIAVMTESDTGVPTGVRLDPVLVGDRPGVIAHMLGDGDTRTLFLKQPSGTYLEIQVWDGLGWDNDRIAEFASSVHITQDAQPSVG